jgi:formate/nitrite transporter FocA (FNT family)
VPEDEQSEHHEEQQEKKAKEEGVPEGDLIYRSVRQDGEFALQQSSAELMWSGLAAGLSMGFSLIAEGLLKAHLPDATWTPLVSKFGYAAGFLIVILGRQQLFTEQTLTAILPLLARNNPVGTLSNVARLWILVLLANLAGTAIISGATALTPAFSPENREAFSQIGQAAMSHTFLTTLVRGIYAGYVIAVMVWLLPGAEAARLWIVVLLAYLVGVGEFSHIIAGSSECLYVVFTGERTFFDYVAFFLTPTLIGNAVGGVVFVAALAHAQHAPGSSE